MRIIRHSSFSATPWKNGGGITHEAIRVPGNSDSYRWRVSVAHIDASGPFSDFAAYQRKMVLLRGAGIALNFAGGERRELRQIGDLVEFDGALAPYCELRKGPCVDLNLMVLKSVPAAARVERLYQAYTVPASPGAATLIFSIENALMLESDAGETVELEPWDLAVLAHGGGRLFNAPRGKLSAPGSVFFATIGD